MLESIKSAVSQFRQTKGFVRILTHHDTGGITAGAIIAKAMQREDRSFKISVLKQLDKNIIGDLKKEDAEIFFFLDFGSSNLNEIKELNAKTIIFDNHEISGEIPQSKNLTLVNPRLEEDEMNSSAMAYLFAKELNSMNSDMSGLAVLGMVGDYGDLLNIGETAKSILKSAEDISIKQSMLLFPATRPIHKALEFSSKVYIPGVSGSSEGVLNLLKEANISIKNEDEYRTILDLTSEEISRLVELISARTSDAASIRNAFGFIYLIKIFNRLEDARELSMLLNACGKLGHGDLAIAFCMGSKKAKFFAENIYITYKHMILSGLKWVNINDKIEGEGYVVINAGKEIKETILGTVLSILAASFTYPAGTILVGTAITEEGKLKISSRITGKERKDLNLQKIIEPIVKSLGGEGGGHQTAAGGIISEEKAEEFVSLLQKELEIRNAKPEVALKIEQIAA